MVPNIIAMIYITVAVGVPSYIVDYIHDILKK
jgi:hypothetical protein